MWESIADATGIKAILLESGTIQRWQIHLSTAVVLSIVAGGLLYLNISTVERTRVQLKVAHIIGFAPEPDIFMQAGWPVPFLRRENFDDGAPSWTRVDVTPCVVSLIANIGILIVVAYVSEKILGRSKQ